MSQGKSDTQKQAESISSQDRQKQNQLTGQAQGTLGQFEGPVQQSPFYKSLLTTGIQSTSQAYDNAASNQRQKANAAGFGYAQPVAQGADNQLRSQEARSMADLPNEAAIAATGPALQAAQQTGGMGMGYGGQGSQYFGDATKLQGQRKSFLDQLSQVGQFAKDVGGGVGGAMMGCWIAEVIYGEHDARTYLLRSWLNDEFKRTLFGRAVMSLYLRYGQRVAELAKHSSWARALLRPLFEMALTQARRDRGGELIYGRI